MDHEARFRLAVARHVYPPTLRARPEPKEESTMDHERPPFTVGSMNDSLWELIERLSSRLDTLNETLERLVVQLTVIANRYARRP